MTAPDLSSTVIALTGAGGRLGRVLARHLRKAGATVAGLDAQVPDDPPEGVRIFQADLTDEAAVADALSRVEDEVGPLGGLIHTVGMWAGTPFVETELADWQQMLDVNLTSAFLCFREATRRMAPSRTGRLVAIASKQGADGGVAEQAAYSVSKAGIVRLVEAVAAEYGGQITAAAVAPSTLLFGGEDEEAEGVSVEAVAALCVYLCGMGGTTHNGTVLRAYGTA